MVIVCINIAQTNTQLCGAALASHICTFYLFGTPLKIVIKS